MSTKYKATDIHCAYFIPLTTVGWIDKDTDCHHRTKRFVFTWI